MFKLNHSDMALIVLVLEGFLYGLYSGVFAIYLQFQSSKKDTDKKRSIVFHSICVLYVLSMALFFTDITGFIYIRLVQLLRKPLVSVLRIDFIDSTLFGCCDLISQFILIYRCCIVWGCNIRVVIMPSILAFAFLVIWLAGLGPVHILSGEITTVSWGNWLSLAGLVLSLTVNALVTGLIVFRIFKVFWEVKATDGQNSGATGGSKLWRVMFILIESGMALFSIQLARVVVSSVGMGGDYQPLALDIIVSIHEMLTGITPTIILVRTSMGLSFDDEESMEEAVIGSLRFASHQSNSGQETGSVGIVGQDNRGSDTGVERSSNDIVGQDNRDGDTGVDRSSNDIELVAR